SDDTSAIQQLYGADTGGGGTVVDAEVLSLSMSPSSTTVGNAVTGTVQVRNNGDQSAVIPVTGSGPGNFSYNANTSNVAAGQSTSVTFQWTPASAGNYTLTATANLSGDGNGSNNSKTSNTVSVQNPTQTIDAQVVSASASPTLITQNSGNVTVSAQIRNNGTASATIPVTITGPDHWSNSTSRTLASGASTTVQFSWPASATGSHTFTVSTALSGDSNAGNNSQTTNSVTVSSPTPTTSLYVASVDMSATPYGNGYTLRAVVTVGPNAGAASGAYMYGYWISPTNRYRVGYGYLNSSGQITLQTTTNETGVHRFHVYNVIKSGTPYDSSKNVGNPGTVDVGGGGGSTPTIDASVNNVTVNPTSIALNGGNVTITATVGNNGDNAASVPVSVSGPSGFSDAKSVSVGAGSTQQVTFSWPASVAGSHTFTVSTNLSGDSNSGNNQRTSPTVSVTQASIVDAEVTTLTRSASSVEQNSQPVTFTASVRNNGTSSANFTVRLASSSASVNQTQQVTVASGASQNVQFQWSPSIVGNHSFTATAELSGDSNSSNNSKSVNLSVTSPPPPPPPGGEQVFVGRIYTIKVGSSWYIYTWVDSTDDEVRYGATITATIRAQSGQTKQLTGRTNYGGYALMYTGPVGSGSHTYSVTDITYDGYSYNPSLNVTTSANLPN
ncbi:MAG: CARDB domain-containing protein, partial [Thermomicrobiales bacterium]